MRGKGGRGYPGKINPSNGGESEGILYGKTPFLSKSQKIDTSKISPFDELGYTFIKTIKSGKEAEVFLIENSAKKLFALKVYFPPKERTFRQSSVYTEGKFSKSFSEGRALEAGGTRGKEIAFMKWVQREYFLLKKLFEKCQNIPQPLAIRKNKILMEYLGDISAPAPKLSEIELSPKQAKYCLQTLIRNIETFLEVGIIHGDLSEFNILYWNDIPYIIDFPQSLDIRNSPYVREFLSRDIGSIKEYFLKKYKISENLSEYPRISSFYP